MFRRVGSLFALMVGCAATTAAQQAERPPSVALGRLVAERMCGYCHSIASNRRSEVEAGAPSFVEIANRPGRDAAFLRRFTSETHLVHSFGPPPVAMPTIVLTPRAREDVIVYILSLRLG